LGTASERVRTLAGLDLYELADAVEALGRGETGKGFPLRLQAKARPALSLGRQYVTIGLACY
jgi:hypothetical protein